jgi:hypothetical protein
MRWQLGDLERFAKQQPIDLLVPCICEQNLKVLTFLTIQYLNTPLQHN